MESLPSVSPSMSIVLPSNNSPLLLLPMKTQQRSQLRWWCPRTSVYPLSAAPLFIEPSSSSSNGSASRRRLPRETSALCRACSDGSAREEDAEKEEEDLERALHMDGRIPRSSDQFVKKVSSRAYNMRRHLQQSMDCSSYDGKWKENLGCCFLKVEHGDLRLEISLSSQEAAQIFVCLLKMSGKEFLSLRMNKMP